MKYLEIQKDDTGNGPGVRTTLWVSGCSHHCKGCQNPETWDPNVGKEFTEDSLNEILIDLKRDSGLTISGGDPLFCANRSEVLNICKKVKSIYPEKNIWVWTGYLYEEILGMFPEILNYVDFLVDGKFEQGNYKYGLLWKGSTNQRIINVKESLLKNSIVQEIDSDAN